MTVLVIQHGKCYEPPLMANCRNCRCIFSYEKEDTKAQEVGGDYDYDPIVQCPECGWPIEVEDPNGR